MIEFKYMGGVAKYKIKDFYKGAVYHAYNRGVNKNKIFLDDKDYLAYLKRVRKYKEIYEIDIICYSLIPNHYHYLLKQKSDISISKFMKSLHTSYGQYFNRRHNRIGPLFQDRYKQVVVEDNDKLLLLSAYINANAKIHGLVDSIEKYLYSSYLDYVGLRDGTLCNKDVILKQFGNNKKDYRGFVGNNVDEFRIKKNLDKLSME